MNAKTQTGSPVIARLLALATALWIAPSAPATFATVDWHLYDSSCEGGAAAVEIACGDYGRFLLLQTTAPPGCVAVASGVEDPPAYPTIPVHHAFPIPARRLQEITPHVVPQSAVAGPAHGRLLRSTTGGAARTDYVTTIERWVAVIDFDSPHGESTTWLAGQVAGPAVATVLSPLDEPALQVLGPVGDFHVLARLCEIAGVVDGGSLVAPATINMSFGRPTRAADPTSAATCPVENAACQVAKVAHHLKDRGSWLIAAAGNHGGGLFPASLEEVLAAGMLDLTPFLNGGPTRPAWETPQGADAWIPGNALCLGPWAAPAGSSYSSAMLAGWLVQVHEHPEVLPTLGAEPWAPAWNAQRQCFVLSKGRKLTRWCNAAITSLFNGLDGGSNLGCWRAATEPSVSAPAPGRATSPDPLPSLDNWGDPTHPAPESDPCVPCTASFANFPADSDLTIDLSQSGALPGGIHLDEVSLRVDGLYFEIPLSDTELDVMDGGGLATLVIHNVGGLIPPDASISLWYRMKEDPAGTCSSSAGCFWSSTPMLLGSPK